MKINVTGYVEREHAEMTRKRSECSRGALGTACNVFGLVNDVRETLGDLSFKKMVATSLYITYLNGSMCKCQYTHKSDVPFLWRE